MHREIDLETIIRVCFRDSNGRLLLNRAVDFLFHYQHAHILDRNVYAAIQRFLVIQSK